MIKQILDEIASEPSSNAKMDILSKYSNNELLKSVLYAANSPRVKYYIKQIPEYIPDLESPESLQWGLDGLKSLSSKEFTGNKASNWLSVILSGISMDDAYVIERIIEKDLKIGMGTSNINKVFPNLIEKTPYMGAKPFSEDLAREILRPQNRGERRIAYSQIKMDGRYCNAIIEDGYVYLESRSGEITYLPDSKIMTGLSSFDNCVLNGELTIPGFDRNNSNGIVNSVIGIATKLRDGIDPSDEKSHLYLRHKLTYENALNQIVYTVWDRIELEDYENKKSAIPYNDRLQRLMNEFISNQDDPIDNIELIEQKIVSTYQEAIDHFIDALNRGLEGTILKSVDGAWKDGKPNWQIKMKKIEYYDLKIIGFNYGKKGTKNEHLISSINVESECGQLHTSPSGISETDMKMITNNQSKLIGRIVEVKCSGISHDSNNNYSLLHPVFIKIRNDKDIANTLNECIKIDKMNRSLKIK